MRRWVLTAVAGLVVVSCAVGDGVPMASAQAAWAAGADFITARQYRDPAGVEYLVAFVEYPSTAAADVGLDVIAGTVTQGLTEDQLVAELELGDRALALSGIRVGGGGASLVLVRMEIEVLVLLATGPEPAVLPDLLALAAGVLDRSGKAAERLPGLGDLPPGTEELRTYAGPPES